MDIWDKKKRSEVMSKIRSKNTKPEIALRKTLFAKGYRYRINDKKLPGKPDIVLPQYKTVIFVHGCFWHGHENCKVAHIPKSNIDFWKDKIEKNKERDRLNYKRVILLGWKVIVVWECRISKKTILNLVEEITLLLHESLLEPVPVKIKIYEEVEGSIALVAEDIVPYNKHASDQEKPDPPPRLSI